MRFLTLPSSPDWLVVRVSLTLSEGYHKATSAIKLTVTVLSKVGLNTLRNLREQTVYFTKGVKRQSL